MPQRLSCREWFDWAKTEIVKPDGINSVLVSAIKNLVSEDRTQKYFAQNSALGQLEDAYPSPELKTKYPQASEDLVVFLLSKLAEAPSQRRKIIVICNELSQQPIADTAVARLKLLSLAIASRKPIIQLEAKPSNTEVSRLMDVAGKAERPVKRSDRVAQSVVQQLMVELQLRPAA